MLLKKRDCPVKIRITPSCAYYQLIEMEINGDLHNFLPSAAMGYQFMDFMAAVYQLYTENDGLDCHNHAITFNPLYGKNRRKIETHRTDPSVREEGIFAGSGVFWDEEGPTVSVTLSRTVPRRHLSAVPGAPDPVKIVIEYESHPHKSGTYAYTVDGRDLCYAIGKAGTEAIKKYGFHGYFYSSSRDDVVGDRIDLNQLLFFKAYALDAMDVREFVRVQEDFGATSYATDFRKELELFLFDM